MAGNILRFVDLGGIEPIATQAVYEAVAVARSKGLVPDTLIVCWPRSPLVCIGYFQEVDKEVDAEYCRKNGIPIVRRILGGGAVYLDSNQVFYQVIGARGGSLMPAEAEATFRKLLEAPVRTYNGLGIAATYKPVNDIEVGGRKISGNGAGEVDGISILTGNIIIDFNYDEMTRILRVPNEKFRDKLAKSLEERVTTVKREATRVPSHQEVKDSLVKHFGETLRVKVVQEPLTLEEERLLERLRREKYLSDKWTYENSNRHLSLTQTRIVKISSRSTLGYGLYKSSGGLIRITGEFVENSINEILISGDFTFIPSSKLSELEKTLAGSMIDKKKLIDITRRFYYENKIESPGMTPSDLANAILIASGAQP